MKDESIMDLMASLKSALDKHDELMKQQKDPLDVFYENVELIFGRHPLKDRGYEAAESDHLSNQGHDDESL